MTEQSHVDIAGYAAEVNSVIHLCSRADKKQFSIIHDGQIVCGDGIPFIIGNENFRNGFVTLFVVEIEFIGCGKPCERQRFSTVVVVVQS